MFQFPAFASLSLKDDGIASAGLPHSDIRGSRGICPSPRLFAACHVLLRLREPRHPPCALGPFRFFFMEPSLAWYDIFSSFLPCGNPDAPYARCDLLCLRLLLCLLASSLCLSSGRIASSLVNVLFPVYFRGCRHLPRKLFRRQCCVISRRIVPVVAALFR